MGLGEVVAATILPPSEAERTEFPPVTTVLDAVVMPPLPEGNGYGTLTDSQDYRIEVDGDHVPPGPWANVIANANAGFCVTERGGGFAWVENSYFYRLTPWFNDPVSDPAGEAIYLQDAGDGTRLESHARTVAREGRPRRRRALSRRPRAGHHDVHARARRHRDGALAERSARGSGEDLAPDAAQ